MMQFGKLSYLTVELEKQAGARTGEKASMWESKGRDASQKENQRVSVAFRFSISSLQVPNIRIEAFKMTLVGLKSEDKSKDVNCVMNSSPYTLSITQKKTNNRHCTVTKAQKCAQKRVPVNTALAT